MATELHFPNTFLGHDKVVIEDDDPKKRADLAEKVIDLIRKGHAVFLQKDDGSTPRIRGYDAVDNTWLVDDTNASKKGRKGRATKKVSAKDTTATVVPAQAGG